MPKSNAELSVSDMNRKAKWHRDHPVKGNQALGDSYQQSALLKARLGLQETMERQGRAGATRMDGPNFAFR